MISGQRSGPRATALTAARLGAQARNESTCQVFLCRWAGQRRRSTKENLEENLEVKPGPSTSAKNNNDNNNNIKKELWRLTVELADERAASTVQNLASVMSRGMKS